MAGSNAKEGGDRKAPSSTTINLRLPVSDKSLIDRAAAASGKTRTEFLLETARARAIDVILDKTVFSLDAEAFDAFRDVLDNPPPANARLKELMARAAPWDK
ncbi:DUF1778 domain-containing protein [Afifella marina]|uniref:Uncharacterized conserved protein, DUF1778 family n=1 Tax=Afifella marina DSM 2698 TaxID=1120955 RepID=A0A1G5MKU7_AFIMA|nr:DUF1778 domain-containing protein [Afifella marina]MBK1623894.1 DUF1778 domain-containing protein [Afifella marina DSM 2698]MBK1627190.1 DUF1778 domain-containing protein [Afifella marina]MBK5918781.1 hypothetical protein [Afifella marina]RAI22610.1 hypothetical protein CH311_02775 [Afifella marina DSM 2698]SCZ25847.1 Uncharacterized conserved protein, DUF1778 family [Afifella marina DSM 2698]